MFSDRQLHKERPCKNKIQLHTSNIGRMERYNFSLPCAACTKNCSKGTAHLIPPPTKPRELIWKSHKELQREGKKQENYISLMEAHLFNLLKGKPR